MKTLKLLIAFSLLIATAQLKAQNAEQTVREAEKSINQKVDELHQLAAQKQIQAAFDKIDEINKEISREITWGTFDEKYKEAKMKNPGFTFDIKGDLPPQLSPAFWADFEQKCNKILADQEIIIEGMQSAILLNKMDKCLAYGKQLKTLYETVSGVVENLGTGNVPKFAYDLYQNSKEAIENYEEGENAYVEGLELEAAKAKWNLTIAKTKKSKDQYNEFRRYIKSNQIAINDFNAHIKYLNKLKESAKSGVLSPLTYADNKYNWNYEPFTKEVNKSCADFELYEIKCEDFRVTYEDINRRARKDWSTVKGNILASDDNEKKKEFLDYHSQRWTEYLNIATATFNKTYNKHCGTASQEKKIAELNPDANLPPAKKQEELQETKEEKPSSDENETDSQPEIKNEQTQAKTATPIVPEKKAEPQQNTAVKINTSDKYWENTIPENAEKEWMQDGRQFEIRYKSAGRTVGFRRYDDADFKIPVREESMDNFAIKHGAQRIFSHTDNLTGIWLYQLSFYRADLKTGPEVYFNQDGTITARIKYFIDGLELSEAEYKQKAKNDKSLAPPDVYLDPKWKVIPAEKNIPDPPRPVDTKDLAFHQLTIPANAVKYIDARISSDGDKYYSEYYYSTTNINQYVGERSWLNSKIIYEEIEMGQKAMYRHWTQEGELTRIWFKIFDSNQQKYRDAGFLYSKENGIVYRKYDGTKCTPDEYQNERKKYPHLPATEILEVLNKRPTIAPNSHPDPAGTNQDVTSVWIPNTAQIWRMRIEPKRISIDYSHDHSKIGNQSWHDSKMTIPASKGLYANGKSLYIVSWFEDGAVNYANITGRLQKDGVNISFNNDKTIKKHSYLGSSVKDSEIRKKWYEGIPNIPAKEAYLSPSLKNNMTPPQIPQAEMTPLFRQIWMKESTSANTSLIAEQQQLQEKPPVIPEENNTNNYQQLQREELFKLLEEINKKVEAADKSFDKPYWEETKTGTATMQATNPRQESLDILRSAVPIVERAKYPENKGGLYHLLAIKLVNYSGRVFAFNAKQDFFKLAAELVTKADQLLTSNVYVKNDLSEAYCTSAEVWRNMTQKALWGNHAYNKMDCDKMVIQQYERAVQANPNNQKARKMLEQLKAPKPSVPAEVENFEKIDQDTWNNAQTIMAKLDNNEEIKTPESNPIAIANMTLSIGNGSVSIMRCGGKDWEEIKESPVEIYVCDKIKTSNDATNVSITFESDRTFLAIKNGSEVEFADNVLYITRGGTMLRVQKRGNKFLVISPTAAVGVRGTVFEVNVGNDKSTDTYLYEGLVELRNNSEIGYLLPGQKITAKKGEDKLQQTTFDSNQRIQSEWGTLDIQQQKHEQLVAEVSGIKKTAAKSQNPASTTTAQTSDPFTGVATQSNSSANSSEVSFSWSPSGTFSSVMIQDQIKFGTHNLIARIPTAVNENTLVTVNWYLNNQLVSTGKHTIMKEANFFDGQIVTGGEPINPGKYKVEFVINNAIHKSAEIEILAPEKLDQQKATQKYVVALQAMQQALDLVDRGDLYNAGIKASTVLNDLRTVLYSAPLLPDIQSVTEMSLALMTFTEVIHAANNNAETEANEWVKRSLGHARRSNLLCKDPQFKISTNKIVSALEKAFPEF